MPKNTIQHKKHTTIQKLKKAVSKFWGEQHAITNCYWSCMWLHTMWLHTEHHSRSTFYCSSIECDPTQSGQHHSRSTFLCSRVSINVYDSTQSGQHRSCDTFWCSSICMWLHTGRSAPLSQHVFVCDSTQSGQHHSRSTFLCSSICMWLHTERSAPLSRHILVQQHLYVTPHNVTAHKAVSTTFAALLSAAIGLCYLLTTCTVCASFPESALTFLNLSASWMLM